jgi:hypothetical protein
VRRQVSLLLDHGHPHASHYPIGTVWLEAYLVVERLNRLAITEAAYIQMAVSSLFSKDAARDFSKTVKRLTADG